MSRPESVAIIGLGLMGGSLARDLSARGIRVLAYDSRGDVLSSARAEGIVHDALGADLAGLEAADIVILATPVDVAIESLAIVARRLGSEAVVTDVGSTKAAIADRADALGIGPRFAGSHPLAGDHRSGWEAARSGLYLGVPVFVCPAPPTPEATVRRITDLWRALGAVPTLQAAADHDRRMASLSHIPQILSSALAAYLDDDGIAPHELGPGGRDMTRLAASSPEMWVGICQTNSRNLLVSLERLQDRLSMAQDAIARGDAEELFDYFARGRNWLL